MVKVSLKTRIITIVLLLSVFPLLFISYQLYRAQERKVIMLTGERMHSIAKKAMAGLDAQIAEDSQKIQALALNPALNRMLQDQNQTQIAGFFSLLQEHQTETGEIILVDAQGRIIMASNVQNIGKSVSKDAWFQGSLDTPQIWDFSRSGLFEEPVVIFSAPVQGSAGGVIADLVPSRRFSKFLEETTYADKNILGSQSYMLLINRDGAVLTQPRYEQKLIAFRENLKNRGLQSAAKVLTGEEGYGLEPGRSGRQDMIAYVSAGENLRLRGLRWSLLIFRDLAEVIEPARNSLTKLMVVCSYYVLTILIAIAFLHWRGTSNRLKTLMKITQSIAPEKFDAGLDAKQSDKLEVLARSFNEMAEGLGQAKKELLQAHAFTDRMLRSMIDTLILMDERGTVITCNEAILELLGYTRRELVGRPSDIIFERGEEDRKKLVEAVQKENLTSEDLGYKTKDGRVIPMLLSATTLADRSGNMQGILIIAKDISEKKATENKLRRMAEELTRSNRELEAFAFVTSHDMREPLRKILAFGDLLHTEQEASLNDTGKDYLRRMRSAASRMEQFIEDVLQYSRITSKAKPFEKVSLKDVVKEVLSDLEIRIQESNAKVEIKDLPTIEADRLQMRQLFQNLIGNALKFHKKNESPHVEIGMHTPDNGYAELYVQDHGVGFEDKYVNRIFHPFFRLHSRSEYEGTGIGLAIVHKIVIRHGGDITAHSKVGEGTEFVVKIPVHHENGETQESGGGHEPGSN